MKRIIHQENITKVALAANALEHLCERVVFIGGSIVGLHITDSGAPDVRKTVDVDVIVEVTGLGARVDFESELKGQGFRHDISEDAHLYRFILGELIVDLVPQDGGRSGMETKWYEAAVRTAEIHKLENGPVIRLINAPMLVCTKLEAYKDRGKGDLLLSKDIGDILSLVDGRTELFSEVENAEQEVREFICRSFAELYKSPKLRESISWQLEQDQQEREEIIVERIKQIADALIK